MSQWTNDDPGVGDTAQMLSSAASLDSIVASLTMMSGNVSTSTAGISSTSWHGAAGTAFQHRGSTIAADLRSFAGTLDGYAAALATYAAEVQAIATALTPLRSQLDLARDQAADAQQVINQSRSTQESRDAVSQRREANALMRNASRQVDDLVVRRRNADALLQDTLRTLPTVGFPLVGRALVAAGTVRPFQLDAADLTAILLDLTTQVENGTATPEQVATLAALLGSIMLDASAAASYLDSLGGTRLTALLVALDAFAAKHPQHTSVVADLQARLRTTLAAASTIWSEEESRTFAAALLHGTNAAIAVAYLFGDPDGAPMGAHLTFAMADAIRTWEEQHGQAFIMLDSVVDGQPTSLMVSTLTERFTTDAFGRLIIDPADSVLRQVALHPRLALDWLTSNGNLKFWYDTRDWAATSGHNAPAIVWAAVQTIPGALIGPDMDEDLVTKLARLNADVLTMWAESVLRGSSHFTTDGLQALGDVVAAQLPFWLETTIHAEKDQSKTKVWSTMIDWLGLRGDVAAVTRETLAMLLRLVQADPVASAAVLKSIRQLGADVVSAVAPDANRDASELAGARAAALFGLLDGAALANDLSARAARDRLVGAGLDVAFLPVDAALGTRLGPVAGPAAGLGASNALDQLFANSYDQRMNEYLSSGSTADAAREKAVRELLRELLKVHLAPEVLAASGEDLEALLDQLVPRYLDARSWTGLKK